MAIQHNNNVLKIVIILINCSVKSTFLLNLDQTMFILFNKRKRNLFIFNFYEW